MRKARRLPTPDEVQVLMARARQLRAACLSGLYARGLAKARRLIRDALAPRRRRVRPVHLYPDIG